MFKNKNSVVLGCFSPPVMIATFLFEFISMIYVLIRYKLNSEGRIIAALLFNLSSFQLAEYFVCENSSIAQISSKVGYVAITLLPPLGLHLMYKVAKNRTNATVFATYALATIISAYFLLHPESFKAYECTGNYVIFQIGELQAWVYSTFYLGLIAYTLVLGHLWKKKTNKKIQKNINWLIAGYWLFIAPVALVIIFQPDSRRAVPSIMCGFAVLFAIVLVSKISPYILKRNK